MKNRGQFITPLVLLASLLAPVSACRIQLNDWLGSWKYRIEIRIDYSKIDAALTDFPALVHISPHSGVNSSDLTAIFTELRSEVNRKKIAVTRSDGYTECYVEIEQWDSAGQQAWLWVKVPMVNVNSNTVLYLYYDSGQNDNSWYVGDTGSSPAQKVWDNNYKAVWHLAQSGSGKISEFKDSTSSLFDGTGGGGSSDQVPNIAEASINAGQQFDGFDDYIQVADADAYSQPTTGELMVSFWLDPTVTDWYMDSRIAEYINMLGKGQSGNYEWVFTLGSQHSISKPSEIAFYVHDLDGGFGDGGGVYHSYEVGDKILVVGYIDTSNVSLTCFYQDGSDYTDSKNYIGDVIPENGPAPLNIGGMWSRDQWFKGILDEVRVSNTVRSYAWLKAENYSDRDALLYFGDGNSLIQIYEYNQHENAGYPFGGAVWKGQTFTPSVTHKLQVVKIKLAREAVGAGSVVLNIKATVNGLPVGDVLATGSILCSDVSDVSFTVYTFLISPQVTLTAGTKYAFYFSAPEMDAGSMAFRVTQAPSEYSKGGLISSSNSGSSWIDASDGDLYFEEWGIPS